MLKEKERANGGSKGNSSHDDKLRVEHLDKSDEKDKRKPMVDKKSEPNGVTPRQRDRYEHKENFNVTFSPSPIDKEKEKDKFKDNGIGKDGKAKGSDTIRKSYEEFKSLRDLNNDVSFKHKIKQLLNNDQMTDKYQK